MARITYIHGNKKTIVEEQSRTKSLLKIGLEHDVPIEHSCGGNGLCTTCMCRIPAGMAALNPRSERETLMGVTEDPLRLTCQSTLQSDGDIVVEVPS